MTGPDETGRGDTVPPVSVVIPTYNRGAALPRAVRAALVDDVVREVIVVDDGSTDTTAEVLDELTRSDTRVRALRVDNQGSSRSRHRGAEAATNPVVVFLDDDVVVEPGTVAGHAHWHADGGARVVIGYMPVALTGHRGDDAAARLYAADYERQCRRFDANAGRALLLELWGGNISMRRADALAVGMYSPEYEYARHEDRDLGIRLAKAGLDAIFDRRLIARHEYDRSLAAGLRDAAQQVAGRYRLHQLHGDVLGPWAGPDMYADGLRGPGRWAATAARHPRVGSVELRVFTGATGAFGRMGLTRLQVGSAAIARTILQQREARRLDRDKAAAD